jgi:hypothetical protein
MVHKRVVLSLNERNLLRKRIHPLLLNHPDRKLTGAEIEMLQQASRNVGKRTIRREVAAVAGGELQVVSEMSGKRKRQSKPKYPLVEEYVLEQSKLMRAYLLRR